MKWGNWKYHQRTIGKPTHGPIVCQSKCITVMPISAAVSPALQSRAQIECLFFITLIRGERRGGPQEPGLSSGQLHNKMLSDFYGQALLISFWQHPHSNTHTHTRTDTCSSMHKWLDCLCNPALVLQSRGLYQQSRSWHISEALQSEWK